MKNGELRFDYYLKQLEELIAKSSKQKNPGLWLYQNNARTPLFMLEGLAKMYAGIHNKKKFSKIKEHVKLLEDAIGQIDYYDAFAKEFTANKKIPVPITNYLQAQSREKIQSLNELLHENNWLGDDADRIKKIRKKLGEADWQDEKDDVKSIHKFYVTAINKILEFINEKDFHFTDVENDVHEFRRMIRWLSIYPQALRGCIQLGKSKAAPPKYLTKYLTKTIISSPYNSLPDAGELKHFLLFDQNRFYSLSWMIAELGNLKDSGLKVEVVKEALLQTSKTNEKDALAQAYKLAGKGQKTLQQILDDAEKICKTFCKEKNLEALITGIAKVN
jgi:regulator of replication initiation timing